MIAQETKRMATPAAANAAREGKIKVVGFTPHTVTREALLRLRRAEPSARNAYGCVEWFDYKAHPLKDEAASAEAEGDDG
jgi:hypothetical protein